MLRFIYPICFLFVAVAVEFDPCGYDVPAPKSVKITGCYTPPCKIRSGEDVTLSLEFRAEENHTGIITGLTAKYGNYPGIDGVMSCDGLYSMPYNVKVGCPIEKGKLYRHDTHIRHTFYSPFWITFLARLSLKDKHTEKEFVCFQIMVKVG